MTSSTLDVLTFSIFGDSVMQGVSTRSGGVSDAPYVSLNLGVHVNDSPAAVIENRRRFLVNLNLSLEQTVALNQIHSDRVVTIEPTDAGMGVVEARPTVQADAMLTQAAGVALLIQSADCTLILFHDPVHQAIGVAHAGWRGSVSGIVPKAIAEMTRVFGTAPGDVRAGIAPTIGQCCYEVDEPVLGPLRQGYPQWFDKVIAPGREGHGNLDLQELNRLQLIEAGVVEEHIEVMRLCTSCNGDRFFSERGQGRPTGRFGAVIALRP